MSRGTVNKVIIIGRLGKDPDMRYTPSGTAVTNFSVATNYATKDQDGAWSDQTEWHNISAFGRLAEFSGEYLKKGKLVFIEGRLQTRNWEDQNGVKHYRTDIIASEMQLLGSRSESEVATDTDTPAQEPAAPTQKEDASPESSAEGDDLPF
ncbi:MAG TPA: single-stranded DNA-binding protein [Calditrichaeota bacterium]|nr:single-stranded DNA-binding protein [Calditrichota bacterium]